MVNANRWGPMPTTADHHRQPLTNADYRRLPPTTADYRRLPPTTADYRRLPPTTVDYRRLPPTTADYSWPMQTVADWCWICQLRSAVTLTKGLKVKSQIYVDGSWQSGHLPVVSSEHTCRWFPNSHHLHPPVGLVSFKWKLSVQE